MYCPPNISILTSHTSDGNKTFHFLGNAFLTIDTWLGPPVLYIYIYFFFFFLHGT